MCGRYVSPEEAAIEREFNLVHMEWQFPASFNVAPTQQVPIVRMHDGLPQGVRLRWGLIPYFAQGVPPKYSTINARIETVQTPLLPRSLEPRTALPGGRARLLRMADAGRRQDQGALLHPSQRPGDLRVRRALGFVLADDRGDRIESCMHLTMPANRLLAEIHNTQQPHAGDPRQGGPAAWLAGIAGRGLGGPETLSGRAHGGVAGEHARQQAGERRCRPDRAGESANRRIAPGTRPDASDASRRVNPNCAGRPSNRACTVECAPR